MTISDQGWAAIQAYEYAGRAAYQAREKANEYADRAIYEASRNANNLLFRTMIFHLSECHGLREKKISEALGVKRSFVRQILKELKKQHS
jgi:predicted XRE-type DNA-binding protein